MRRTIDLMSAALWHRGVARYVFAAKGKPMTVHRLGSTLAACSLGLALATSAGAAESLTGSYAAKLSCKGVLIGGNSHKSKRDVTIEALEDEGYVWLKFGAGGGLIGETVRALVVDDGNKPERAKLAGVDCPMAVASLANVTVQADAVAKAGSEKATLKGTLVDTTLGNRVVVCKFSAKRTSSTPPDFELCDLQTGP
jgi:hypothetical protein